MKIALIGDPHFANRGVFGYPTETKGVNSRLQWIQKTMNHILDEIEDQDDIDQIVIMGDITHYHGRLTPPVGKAIRGALERLTTPTYILTGNHDIDENNVSILDSFDWGSPNINFVTQGLQLSGLYFFPYSERSWEKASKPIESLGDMLEWSKAKYIFMHHHFNGAVHAECEFVPPNGLPLDVIPEGARVICGHYHMQQTLERDGKTVVNYVGVPLQHDFGETGYPTGYSILDTDTDEIEFIPVDVAPKFYKIEVTDETKLEDIPGRHELDYYRLDIPLGEIPNNFEELTSGLAKTKIKRLKVDIRLRSRVEEVLPGIENLTVPDVLEAFVILNTEEGARRDHLHKLGIELLGGE